MIRLFAENPGQANPNLALRWCVDRKTLDELKEKGVKNPQLLFVIARQPLDSESKLVQEIERKLVPLDQAMEWLGFNRPGRYTIHTTIVWDDDKRFLFEARRLLMRSKRESRFGWEMFDCDGKFSRTHWTEVGRHSIDEGSLDVVVAKDFFAKEPPAWLNWWVNLWFKAMEVGQPTNQCPFRRRAILAFTVQPIPVFIWALLKSLTRLVTAIVLTLLCGRRGISFKPVVHPFGLCLDNVWQDMDSSVFLTDKHDKRRSFLLVPVMLVFPASLFTVLSIFIANLFLHFNFWLIVMAAVELIVCAVAGFLLGYFLFGFIGRGLRTIWKALSPPPSAEELERKRQADKKLIEETRAKLERKAREKQERKQKKLKVFYEELQDVACIGVPLKPSLELLPERRKTFHLRYTALKAKVCKQYPR